MGTPYYPFLPSFWDYYSIWEQEITGFGSIDSVGNIKGVFRNM